MFWLISVGVLHLKDGESPPQGGKPGWAALPSTRIGPWFRLLKKMAEAHGLVPEFEITLEATHHGPITNKPTMFLEIGEFLSLFLLSELISSLLALLKLPFRCVSEFLSSSPV
jgi:hypothetical protein